MIGAAEAGGLAAEGTHDWADGRIADGAARGGRGEATAQRGRQEAAAITKDEAYLAVTVITRTRGTLGSHGHE